MRIWAISDLHLPGGSPRRRQRMEVDFGWGDYINKMARIWDALVQPDDLVSTQARLAARYRVGLAGIVED